MEIHRQNTNTDNVSETISTSDDNEYMERGDTAVITMDTIAITGESSNDNIPEPKETRETEAKPADDTVTTQVATTEAVTSDGTFVLSLTGSSYVIASVVVLYWGESNNTVFR